MLGAAPIVAGNWCSWLYGAPEDRGPLAARFRLEPTGDLHAAFSRALAERAETASDALCGRFVAVALDRGRVRCQLTRDQLGAQPLVYARLGSGFVFAEHERDLLDVLSREQGPDRLALLQWIENGLSIPGRTLYDDVQRLPAGHRLVLERSSARIERWWSPRYEGVDTGSADVLAAHLRDEAFAAVRRAAGGARRPAVKLSGGLDSACVAAGLVAGDRANRATVAVGGTFAAYPASDESDLIQATAQHMRLPLELVAFDSSSSMLAPALDHIARWRLPPATPNLFLWQPVTAWARELGVDRMLDGEGGDELFGFAAYLIADMVRAGRLFTAWSLTAQIPGIGLHPRNHVRRLVLRRYGLSPLLPEWAQRRRQMRAATERSSAALIGQADARALTELRLTRAADRRDGPAWWRFQAESLVDLRDLLDMGTHFRREAVDAEIDLRHPFLYDLRLVESALRLPPREQFDPIRDRPLLRKALTGLIPEAVRTRHEKSHFSTLVLDGLRTAEADLIEPLRRSDAPIRDYVDGQGLARMIEVRPDDRKVLSAGPLWRVAIANRWLMPGRDASA
jgi:asparagine synthase (glutamine-hydrolysing)